MLLCIPPFTVTEGNSGLSSEHCGRSSEGLLSSVLSFDFDGSVDEHIGKHGPEDNEDIHTEYCIEACRESSRGNGYHCGEKLHPGAFREHTYQIRERYFAAYELVKGESGNDNADKAEHEAAH